MLSRVKRWFRRPEEKRADCEIPSKPLSEWDMIVTRSSQQAVFTEAESLERAADLRALSEDEIFEAAKRGLLVSTFPACLLPPRLRMSSPREALTIGDLLGLRL